MLLSASNAICKRRVYRNRALAVLLVVVGVLCLALFFTKQIAAPTPVSDQSVGDDKQLGSASGHPALPFSVPAQLDVPSIHIKTPVIVVGKHADGSVAVPPGSNFDKAAWYEYSPSPGQAGMSVIEGHVDYANKGPGVFFELGSIKKGNTVTIRREDAKAATFIIYKVAVYPKDQFPTNELYGPTNQPSLALITCGGQLDRRTGTYSSNTIAFGVLASSAE